MPSAKGENWEKYQKKFADDEQEEKKITPLSDECVYIGGHVAVDERTNNRPGTSKC
jgi:hypothetical protein